MNYKRIREEFMLLDWIRFGYADMRKRGTKYDRTYCNLWYLYWRNN